MYPEATNCSDAVVRGIPTTPYTITTGEENNQIRLLGNSTSYV
jgi:hypothetical protein